MKRIVQKKATSAVGKQKKNLLRLLGSEYKYARFVEKGDYVSIVASEDDDTRTSDIDALICYISSSASTETFVYVGYADANKSKITIFVATDAVTNGEFVATNVNEASQHLATCLEHSKPTFIYGSLELMEELKGSVDKVLTLVGKTAAQTFLEVDDSEVRRIAKRDFSLQPIDELHQELTRASTVVAARYASITLAVLVLAIGLLTLLRPTRTEVVEVHRNDYEGYELQHSGTPFVSGLNDVIELTTLINSMNGLQTNKIRLEKGRLSATYLDANTLSLAGVKKISEQVDGLRWMLGSTPYFELENRTESGEIVDWFSGRSVNAEELYVHFVTALKSFPETETAFLARSPMDGALTINGSITGENWSLAMVEDLQVLVAQGPFYVTSMNIENSPLGMKVDFRYKIVGGNDE
ncbi:hypothetical protein L1D14_10765 [Vibrio tubiashii]|uniref:hypothetical protein n=1 Tax=Vibrio tubiashii TaxID=29498 RepID=UPI001EFEC7EB|nr:hypothetical protein [Vibrio tubiashii]MCG9576720.1 hypothetical protein [Vibrio tubiashii]